MLNYNDNSTRVPCASPWATGQPPGQSQRVSSVSWTSIKIQELCSSLPALLDSHRSGFSKFSFRNDECATPLCLADDAFNVIRDSLVSNCTFRLVWSQKHRTDGLFRSLRLCAESGNYVLGFRQLWSFGRSGNHFDLTTWWVVDGKRIEASRSVILKLANASSWWSPRASCDEIDFATIIHFERTHFLHLTNATPSPSHTPPNPLKCKRFLEGKNRLASGREKFIALFSFNFEAIPKAISTPVRNNVLMIKINIKSEFVVRATVGRCSQTGPVIACINPINFRAPSLVSFYLVFLRVDCDTRISN